MEESKRTRNFHLSKREVEESIVLLDSYESMGEESVGCVKVAVKRGGARRANHNHNHNHNQIISEMLGKCIDLNCCFISSVLSWGYEWESLLGYKAKSLSQSAQLSTMVASEAANRSKLEVELTEVAAEKEKMSRLRTKFESLKKSLRILEDEKGALREEVGDLEDFIEEEASFRSPARARARQAKFGRKRREEGRGVKLGIGVGVGMGGGERKNVRFERKISEFYDSENESEHENENDVSLGLGPGKSLTLDNSLEGLLRANPNLDLYEGNNNTSLDLDLDLAGEVELQVEESRSFRIAAEMRADNVVLSR